MNSSNSFITSFCNCLSNTRDETLRLIENIDKQALNFRIDNKSNSIGMISMHIAAMSNFYAKKIFDDKGLDFDDLNVWFYYLPGNLIIKRELEHDSKFISEKLIETGNIFISRLQEQPDEWFFINRIYDGKKCSNLDLVMHTVFDEVSHQSQIRWILKRVYVR